MYRRLLTIQDVSCVGQCSATVALPIVSACAVECAVLPCAVLSNHTGGFRGWSLADLTSEMDPIRERWLANGLFFDAFYTGYVCPEQIDPILRIMDECAAPGAIRIVDPAMADDGRLYPGFGPDFPAQMARLCNGADYILPNLTEAALLLGREPKLQGYDRAWVEEVLHSLRGIGACNVVLTGVSFSPDELGVAVLDGDRVEYRFNPRLNRSSHGTGDVFASVFAGAMMRGRDAVSAAGLAAKIVCDAIKATPQGHWYGVAFERTLGTLAAEFPAPAEGE